jgi:hypothetical protein
VPTTVPIMKISMEFLLLVCASGILVLLFCSAMKSAPEFQIRDPGHAPGVGYVT